MATKWGSFGEATFTTIGDPFDDRKRNNFGLAERTKGKQFVTNPPHRGKNTTAVLFEKAHKPLAVGKPYMDQSDVEKVWRKEANKKMENKPKFKPVSYPKKAVGSGAHYGTFGGPIKYEPGNEGKGDDVAGGASKERSKSPPNFKTKPPQKGSFGIPGTTLGKFEYTSDPFKDPLQSLGRTDKGEKPFRASFPDHGEIFDRKIYSIDKMPPEKKIPKIEREKKVFRPSSVANWRGTINKFPEYKASQFDPPKKQKGEHVAEKVFRPTPGSKTGPTRSIAYHFVMA